MKKTLFTLAIVVSTAAAYAQGFVEFYNAGNTRVSTNSAVNGVATGRAGSTTGVTYYYALFTSSSAPSSSAAISGTSASLYAFQSGSGWTFDNPSATTGYIGAAYATNNGTVGQFQSEVGDPNSTSQTLTSSSAGQYFTIVGWSANIGSTLASLEAWYANAGGTTGWVGQSAASGLITPSAGGSAPGVAILGTSAPTIPGFLLGEVATPEPATMALAAIGGASLLLFRRKK